jgi:opacity protein-like surface antigen
MARSAFVTILCLVAALASPAAAEEKAPASDSARDAQIERLEQQVQALTDELASLRTQVAVPEDAELKSSYGMGPAASKIYGVPRGLSIGGYAEGFYTNYVGDKTANDRDRADALRLVLYTGYKFTERILFNAEIEFEHATTSATESSGGGSVSVEFANLDFLLHDTANARVGMMLMPMGFVNEIHEPPFFYGVARPEVERRLIPSTWRELGVGGFGRLGDFAEYRAYVTTGLNARGLRPNGTRDARQSGNRAYAEDLAFVGRLDFTPLEGLLVGGSFYHGEAGQDQSVGGIDLPDTPITIWDLHTEFDWEGLRLRGLVSMAHIDDAGDLTRALRPVNRGGIGEIGANDVIGSAMFGAYGEVAYDLLHWLAPGSGMSVSPFFRYEYLDTQWNTPSGFEADGANQAKILTAGLSFKPHRNVVLKTDYRQFNLGRGEQADEVNVGVGLAF